MVCTMYVCIRVERDVTRHWVKYISKISRFISSKRIVCFIVCFFVFFFFLFSLLVNHLTLINGKYVPIIYVICMYIYTHMFAWYASGNSSCSLLLCCCCGCYCCCWEWHGWWWWTFFLFFFFFIFMLFMLL